MKWSMVYLKQLFDSTSPRGNSMKARVCKSIEFDAAHRLFNYSGKCFNLHGHRYRVDFEFEGHPDERGIVMDFSLISKMTKNWIDENWDHNVLLHREDPLVELIDCKKLGMSPFFLCDGNPTAEFMAEYLYHKITMISVQVKVIASLRKVRVYETPTCYAEFKI